MNKRGLSKVLIIFLIIFATILVAALAIFAYLFFSTGGGETITIPNPITNLSDQEAAEQFNETFVRYLMYSIGAHNLHNPLFSSDTPKLEIHVSEDIYNAEVIKGTISVHRGEIPEKDIILTTTRAEAVQMMKTVSNVKPSFEEGRSTIDLVVGEIKLASKGYLKIYDKFN